MRTESRAAVPLLILIILALACLLLARAEAAGPETGDMPEMLRAAGGRLAYAYADGRVYFIQPDGTQAQWVSYGRSLAWSPDGQQIVLDAYRQMDLGKGQEILRVAQNDGRKADRSLWLPKMDRLLVFNSQEPGLYLDDEVLVADGSLGLYSPQSVSPDGRRVAFVRRDEADMFSTVSIIDLDTGRESPVELPWTADIVRDFVYYFAWSPAGDEVLFTWATASDSGTGPPDRLRIMRVGAEGGLARPLLAHDTAENLTAAAWSPDGDAVACYHVETDESLRPAVSLHILDMTSLSGGEASRHRRDLQSIVSNVKSLLPGDAPTSPLSWSPDGQVLYFSVRDGRTGISSLRLVTRDGQEARLLADELDLYSLGWLPYSGDVHLPSPQKAPPDGWPGTLPAERGGATAQVAYDRAGAMDYALNHCTEADMYCPVGICYADNSTRCASGGDCAHFVSHCLYAGGLSNFGGIGVGHNLSGSTCYVTGGIIIRAKNQHDWLLSGGRGATRTAATQLDQGDVMVYDWDGVSSWNHVAMIVGNNSHGDVRVASHTSYGCDLDWSMGGAAVYEFIHVLAAPAAPRLPNPVDDAVITDTMPSLSWAAVGASHRVQVAQDDTFVLPLMDTSGLHAPELTITSPLAPGLYYWRAQASDTNGTSPWSEIWSFLLSDTVPVYLPFISNSPSPPCQDLIVNGGFEADGAWTLGGSRQPVYTTDQVFSEQRSVLCGISPPADDASADSAVYQVVAVPDGIASATLGFWVQRHSEDIADDRQQVLVLDDQMQTDLVLMDLLSNDGVWSYAAFDLSAYAGQTIYIYFNVINDGDGARTWMYLDDVSLGMCF